MVWMSLTIEQVVTQVQQIVSTLEAQVADPTRLREAVLAINNLANRSSLERHSESHRCERPWSFEGMLWPKGRFSAVVEADGGVLSWCEQGV